MGEHQARLCGLFWLTKPTENPWSETNKNLQYVQNIPFDDLQRLSKISVSFQVRSLNLPYPLFLVTCKTGFHKFTKILNLNIKQVDARDVVERPSLEQRER